MASNKLLQFNRDFIYQNELKCVCKALCKVYKYITINIKQSCYLTGTLPKFYCISLNINLVLYLLKI